MERPESHAAPGVPTPTVPSRPQAGERTERATCPASGTGSCTDGDREGRLVAVLTAYLQAVDSGTAPARPEWLAAHPDLADDLEAFLRQEDRLHRLVGPAAESPGDVSGPSAPRAEDQPWLRDLLAPEPSPPPDEGIDFGDYILLETIARGGMGIVFRARHKSLGRLVALKMILGGDLATEEDRRRFRHETGAIAQLDHPNIVPIYEAGEHRGHCYYAMKLIEGGGLDRRLGESRGDPRPVVRLMVDVARAVHHAHQRGILHRDLKPSNILIDDEARPYVADFGLSKRLETDAADSTRTGLVLGTPSYMAPEQATGRRDAVTTATDVYGLGAVLYALLSGRPPFRGESILETMELVRLREPDPPSNPGGSIDRDLQTICLTCLRKEPGRRYGTAAALADDLEQWLAGEPIAARPMGRAERVGRWIRREPLSAGLVGLVVLLVTLGVAGLIVSNVLIARERDEARTQRRIALEQSRHAADQHRRADERSRQARRAVDEMYTQVAERWLYDQPKLTDVQRDFLEKALTFYEALSRDDADDPSVEVDRARALARVAWIRLRLGRPETDAAALHRPVEILRALCDRYPRRDDYRKELAEAYSDLGAQFSEQRRWGEANQAIERAVDVYRELVRRQPAEPGHRTSLAMKQARLGVQYGATGQAEEAQRLGSAALAALDDLRRTFPGRTDPHDSSARMMVLEELGCILVDNRRFAEAEAVLRESLAIEEHLPDGTIARQDRIHRAGHTNLYLARALVRLGRDGEAEAILGRARSLFEQLARDYPDLPPYRVDLVDAQLGLSEVLTNTGRIPEARELVRQLVLRAEELASAYPDLVFCRRALMAALLRQGRLLAEGGPPPELERTYRRAIAVGERLSASDPAGVHPRHSLASARLELASLLRSEGRPAEARTLIDRSIAALEDLVRDRAELPAFKQSLATGHVVRGELLLADGRSEDARGSFRRAAALFGEVAARVECDPEFAGPNARFLASCPLPDLRDPSRAVEVARFATRRFPRRGDLWSALALSSYRAGDSGTAIAAAQESIRLRNGAEAPDRLVLAMAYHRAGDGDRARESYRAAIAAIPPGTAIPGYLRALRQEAADLLETGSPRVAPRSAPSAAHAITGRP